MRRAAAVPSRYEISHAPKGLRLWASTLLICAGVVGAVAALWLPPALFVFGKVPVVMVLASGASVLLLLGWTVLKQGYTLRTLLLAVFATALFLTVTHYRVRVTTVTERFFGPRFLTFDPNWSNGIFTHEGKKLEEALNRVELTCLFGPVFKENGLDPAFGTDAVIVTWPRLSPLDSAVTLIEWRYFPAHNPQPQAAQDLISAYAILKGNCLTLDYYEDSANASSAPPVLYLYDPGGNPYIFLTRENALKVFCTAVEPAWGNARPLLKALAEREPDPLLRKAAAKELAQWLEPKP